jgi:hypothetical protein
MGVRDLVTREFQIWSKTSASMERSCGSLVELRSSNFRGFEVTVISNLVLIVDF